MASSMTLPPEDLRISLGRSAEFARNAHIHNQGSASMTDMPTSAAPMPGQQMQPVAPA